MTSTLSSAEGLVGRHSVLNAFAAHVELSNGKRILVSLFSMTSCAAYIESGGPDLRFSRNDAIELAILLGRVEICRIALESVSEFSETSSIFLATFRNELLDESLCAPLIRKFASLELQSDFIQNYEIRADVVAISSTAIAFAASSSVMILPGQNFERARLDAGYLGATSLDITVLGSYQRGKERVFHARLKPFGYHARRVISSLALINFAENSDSASTLRKQQDAAGLAASRLRSVLSMGVAVDATDFFGVSTVRAQAYVAAGKADESEDLIDSSDRHAVVLLARVGNLAVGTVRMISQRYGSLPFRHSYPGTVASPDETTCEISRLAVVPAFQKSDVALLLMQHIVDLAVLQQQKIGYVLATPALEGLYEKSGARLVARGAHHPHMAEETLALFSFEIARIIRGLGVVPALQFLLIWPASKRYQKYGILASKPARIRPVVGRLMLMFRDAKNRYRRGAK